MCIRDRCGAVYYLSPSDRFVAAGVQAIGAHWLGFLMSVVLNTDKFFDITEDIAYFAMIAWQFSTIQGEPSLRQQIVYGCAMMWCIRLFAFVGWRVLVRGSDWRFEKLIKSPAYNLFGWTSGGTWCWANGFCLWSLADAAGHTQTALGVLDFAGLVLFGVGFGVEIMADLQKYQFNASFQSGKNDHWIHHGLWGWSRHPNYAGEITLWAGLALMSVSGRTGSWANVVLPLVTPAWSFVFLLFTSLMLLEKRADSKWGNQLRYQAYKRNTPVLFPLMS
eukprot:TRINITY_DN46463_c0_g1_i3.p1 TRINITY_DN46463_c0_g1~~TRINITY_DN46463_c0_g1_i3.p1  ORF type:complete len:277 (-),score=52.68 TRINITY_DN46463_c0_g1_i3:283-1113(-)